jgi:hypothetical protein
MSCDCGTIDVAGGRTSLMVDFKAPRVCPA